MFSIMKSNFFFACVAVFFFCFSFILLSSVKAMGAETPLAPVISDSGSDTGIPTEAARHAVRLVDEFGGDIVDRDLATLIVTTIVLALYRILQWIVGRMTTPTGTAFANGVRLLLAVLFGSDAAWKRLRPSAGSVECVEREKLLKKLANDNPLIADDINKMRYGG